MKVVVNNCYGGFKLSEEAYKYIGIPYKKEYGFIFPENSDWLDSYECRTNHKLIEFIEKFGQDRASGNFSKLKIEEVPSGTLFRIQEYDGSEWIETEDDLKWWLAT